MKLLTKVCRTVPERFCKDSLYPVSRGYCTRDFRLTDNMVRFSLRKMRMIAVKIRQKSEGVARTTMTSASLNWEDAPSTRENFTGSTSG